MFHHKTVIGSPGAVLLTAIALVTLGGSVVLAESLARWLGALLHLQSVWRTGQLGSLYGAARHAKGCLGPPDESWARGQ